MSDNGSVSERRSNEGEAERREINVKEESDKLVSEFKEGLSHLSETIDGSYCYSSLVYTEKELENLYYSLSFFKHLKFINLSKNKIKDISIAKRLSNAVTIDFSNNEIEDISFLEKKLYWPVLNQLNLSNNKLKKFINIYIPSLYSLNLNNNIIEELQLENYNSLVLFEARNNKITNLLNVNNNRRLKEIYLAENSISVFNGLNNMPNLKKINLRKNIIEDITDNDLPNIPSLRYLNLRENKVKSLGIVPVILEKLSLSYLNLLNNEFPEDIPDIKKEIITKYFIDKTSLTILKTIKTINKEEITTEDLNEILEEEREKQKETENKENSENDE